MVTKNSKVKDYRIFYLGCFIVIFIVVAISFYFGKAEDAKIENFSDVVVVEELEKNINQNKSDKLKTMDERERMEFYFGIFLDYIESAEYEKAYNLLYGEFKNNYFPSLESFTKYAQKTFPELAEIKYENIERNGDVYVLWIEIIDVINGVSDERKKMNIVIRENDYNDFEMSFSVI